jgi:hypothetical protein
MNMGPTALDGMHASKALLFLSTNLSSAADKVVVLGGHEVGG